MAADLVAIAAPPLAAVAAPPLAAVAVVAQRSCCRRHEAPPQGTTSVDGSIHRPTSSSNYFWVPARHSRGTVGAWMRDHYARELKREHEEIVSVPDIEAAEIGEILAGYGLEPHEYAPVVNSLRRNPQAWLEFMMRFELGLEKPEPRRAPESAATIAVAYVVGGLVPLAPYAFVPEAGRAVLTSVGVTLAALLFFGYVKERS